VPQPLDDLGRLVTVHKIAPIHIQRAIFLALLSFLFFLAMMFAFYLRQQIGYFVLATAFLITYLIVLFSLFSLRRSSVQIFENAIRYRGRVIRWSEVESVQTGKPLIIRTKKGESVTLPSAIEWPDAVVRQIEFFLSAAN
jgi:Ca2+/Na+ antiporter